MKVHDELPEVIKGHFKMSTREIFRHICTGIRFPEFKRINEALKVTCDEWSPKQRGNYEVDFEAGLNDDSPLYHDALPEIIPKIRNPMEAKAVLALIMAAPPPENHEAISEAWNEMRVRFHGIGDITDHLNQSRQEKAA